MNGLLIIASGSLLVVFIGLAAVWLYREVFFFEGIRLGGSLHQWLYDRWASGYDADKHKVQKDDVRNLVCPLLEKLNMNNDIAREPLVLDVATGTGRFPAALLSNTGFTGRVIGLDISSGMLKQAAEKLMKYGSRAVLLKQPALPLPFSDGAFDVVSCIETIELLPDIDAHLREFNRVMRPGGILLLSRNTGQWGMNGAVCQPEVFSSQLFAAGFQQIEITPWWRWFDLVWACKPVNINRTQ